MLVVWESFLMLAGAGLLGGVGLLALPAAADQPVAGGAVVGLAVGALLGSLARFCELVQETIPVVDAFLEQHLRRWNGDAQHAA